MVASRRILYIEDNPANVRLVERLLHDEGFQVLHASDGFEGVQCAVRERGNLDLILMDINMPGMDGYEAATKLKTIEGFESIPIVAVTVNTLKGDRKRSLAAGCDGYIAKPIDIHSFPEKIREYIEGRRDRIQACDERYYLREHTRKLVDRLESSLGQLRVTSEQMRHKDKLASLGEMAASLAHELNNPISSISFAVHLLAGEGNLSPRQRRQLELIERNAERLRKLADSLTSFARPSEGSPSLVDVRKAVSEVLLLAEHEFRSRGIPLQCRVAEDLPPVWASEAQLHHVLLNLLRNAAQAVAARRDAPPAPGATAPSDLQVALEAACTENGYVSLAVSDTGVGIHPDYQDRLFTPFFSTKPKGEGTGLGLYIVKQIVDDLGGRVEMNSTVGQGTTFRILLPSSPPS
ncbi:MAG: hybrid sensor histidine kinase/response regulator [Deferrisomatales bacterium]